MEGFVHAYFSSINITGSTAEKGNFKNSLSVINGKKKNIFRTKKHGNFPPIGRDGRGNARINVFIDN